ncbi:MAG: DUF3152 domain-containing protein [Sporichthyaceae bacterium]
MAVLVAPALIVAVALLAAGGEPGVEAVAEASDDPVPRVADLVPVPSASASPKPAPKKTVEPMPAPKAAAPKAVRPAPTGRYATAAGRDAAPKGKGKLIRYAVEVEQGLAFAPTQFAAEVHRVLNHERSWGRGGAKLRFERVDRGPVRFRVSLSSPALTDRQCHPLRTFGRVSCFNGRRAVINADRWTYGSWTYGKDVAGYREYVINHEVGHALGYDHVRCRKRGAPAPVMVQQTKSLEGCAANPWPHSEPAG